MVGRNVWNKKHDCVKAPALTIFPTFPLQAAFGQSFIRATESKQGHLSFPRSPLFVLISYLF